MLGPVDVELLSPERLGIAPPAGLDAVARWARQREAPLSDELEATIAGLGDIVYVGFETPDNVWQALCARGAPALDLRLHPCRFGPDYYFLARSNLIPLRDLVDQAPLQQELALEAAALEFDAFRLGHENRLRQDALLTLQMPLDSALLDAWGFANLGEHVDELTRLSREYPVIWVRPHPHSPPGEADRLAFLSLENARLTDRSAYEMLASGQVSHVIALSSSVLHEATNFGVESVALRPDLSHGYPVRSEFTSVRMADLFGPIAAWFGNTNASGAGAASRSLKALLGMQWATSAFLPPKAVPPQIPSEPSPVSISAKAYGWHEPDAWGVWSTGLAALDFSWPSDQVGPLTLEISAAVYTGGRGVTDEVEIWSNGRRITTAVLPTNRGDPALVRFEVEKPKHGDCLQLVFYRRTPRRPCDIEGVPDFRELGLMLFSISRAPALASV